jgi:YVTN family beta-propeller protein
MAGDWPLVTDPGSRTVIDYGKGTGHAAGRSIPGMRTGVRVIRTFLGAALAGATLVSAAPTAEGGETDRIVWVALEGDGELGKVDLAEGVLRRVDLRGGGPHNITVAPDGSAVAALWASNRIVIVRRGERTFVELGGAPHDVKIARNMVVVANQATERVQLVRLNGTFVRRILLKADPHDLAVDPKQRHAWVTLEGSDDLAVVNLLDRRESVRYVDTDGSPHDILFAPDGTLWVTDWNGALHVLRGPRGRPVASIPLGLEAHHLDFTPDGRFAWVTDHAARELFVLRVRTRRVVERIEFPGEPHHVTVVPGGRRVVVADHANGRLVVYDARTRERVRAIPVGSEPHGVWAVERSGR